MTPHGFPSDLPRPAVSRETLPWWEAAAEHRLVIQTCAACGVPRHPPGPMCPRCHATGAEWREVSGRGALYTYAIVRQAFLPSLAGRLPYAVIVVELEELPGIRLTSNLVDTDLSQLAVGAAVELVWDDVAPGLALPRFRLR